MDVLFQGDLKWLLGFAVNAKSIRGMGRFIQHPALYVMNVGTRKMNETVIGHGIVVFTFTAFAAIYLIFSFKLREKRRGTRFS